MLQDGCRAPATSVCPCTSTPPPVGGVGGDAREGQRTPGGDNCAQATRGAVAPLLNSIVGAAQAANAVVMPV